MTLSLEIKIVIWKVVTSCLKKDAPSLLIMMMSCFCGFEEWLTNERRLSLISSPNHCQRFLASQILDKLWAGFKPVQNLISDVIEWSCVAMVTTAPRCHTKKAKLNAVLNVLTVAFVPGIVSHWNCSFFYFKG